MSVATVNTTTATATSPPAAALAAAAAATAAGSGPVASAAAFATVESFSATDSLTTMDDPFAQYLRTLPSRPPPRAISPRVYGRSPRLPSALPLSASPRLAEPVTPDRQSVLPLFPTDDGMDMTPAPNGGPPHSSSNLPPSGHPPSSSAAAPGSNSASAAVDDASEKEIQRRVKWARDLPPAPHRIRKADGVVDEDVAADLFSKVPRKFAASGPPLPAMSVPDFLRAPTPDAAARAARASASDANMSTASSSSSSSSVTAPQPPSLAIAAAMGSNPITSTAVPTVPDSNSLSMASNPLPTDAMHVAPVVAGSNPMPPSLSLMVPPPIPSPNNANITTMPSPPPPPAAIHHSHVQPGPPNPSHVPSSRADVSNYQFSMGLAPLRPPLAVPLPGASGPSDPLTWDNSAFPRSPNALLGNPSAFKEEIKLEMPDLSNLMMTSISNPLDRMDGTQGNGPVQSAAAMGSVNGNIDDISATAAAAAASSGAARVPPATLPFHGTTIPPSFNMADLGAPVTSVGGGHGPVPKRRPTRTREQWDGGAVGPAAKKPPTRPPNAAAISETDPLCCTKCGSRFARRSNLYKHLRSVHEQERKFSCDLCSLKFKRQDHLIKHKRSVHAKVRNFMCDICGIGFAEKFNRDKHRRNIHNNKRPFRCDCGAYFQDRDKMLNCLQCKRQNEMAAF